MGFYRLDHRPARDGKGHIVSVTRVGYYYLIARVEARHIGEHNGLRATGSDDNLVGREVDTVLGIVAYHLGTQRFRSLRGRVVEYVLVEVMHRIERALRRMDVGLTDVQMVDMNAVALGSVSVFRQFTNRRLWHILRTSGNIHVSN